ncbi:MAG TPA: hypothetical protein VLH56_16405, partial [Dissulfurispiraceae bacterium]|nr:hypothetical protein [Dissulfurispiraceae bacterium]
GGFMFTHRYISETEYQVIEYTGSGERILPKDQHDYLKWCEKNEPKIEASGRFLSVVDGKIEVAPAKEDILAAEAAEIAAHEKKAQDIVAAKEQIVKIEADVDKASDIAALKAAVVDLIKQVRTLMA